MLACKKIEVFLCNAELARTKGIVQRSTHVLLEENKSEKPVVLLIILRGLAWVSKKKIVEVCRLMRVLLVRELKKQAQGMWLLYIFEYLLLLVYSWKCRADNDRQGLAQPRQWRKVLTWCTLPRHGILPTFDRYSYCLFQGACAAIDRR